MDWLKKLFSGTKKAETKTQLAHLLKEQTGDPAFLHRTDWIIAYGKKDFKTALEKLNQALQIVPNDPYYLALRALTHYSMNNYTDAQSDLKAALQSNPAQKEALDLREAMKADADQCRDRARELSKQKEIRRALDELNRAVELEPDNPLNFFFRGVTYVQVEDYDAAFNDVTHTLQLDPQYPDGQEALQHLENMVREKKESTSPTTESSESFFFICTGNASLVNAYNDLFQVGALAYHGAAGHYSAGVGNLDLREQESSKASLPFVGQSHMGSKSTPVSHMHEVLQTLRVAASGEIHVAFVSVNQTGVSWVQEVYGELLNQAVSQGILPYEMYVTNDKAAAQFLLDSFEKVS
jgi:tetratricopeptide (TPR) repeat protein